MRHLIVCCAIAIVGCAPTGAMSAQAVLNARTVEACLTQAADDLNARRACIGAATEACIESDDANASTAGMVLCARGEQTQWVSLRERYVTQLRTIESENQETLLEAVLTEHPRWIQARCAYAASYYEGGSLARYLGAACVRDGEAELALALHARLFDER